MSCFVAKPKHSSVKIIESTYVTRLYKERLKIKHVLFINKEQ